MTPRRKRAGAIALAVLVALISVAAWRDGRCGRRIAAERVTNRPDGFDFASPPCSPATKPDADVRMAYLGIGGVLIEWRGAALLSAPYYTRQGPFEALFGELRVDADTIARKVAPYAPETWDVILSGHSHYDHLADVPELMQRHATGATLWTNRSGLNMLQAFPALEGRVQLLPGEPHTWVRPRGADGEPLPFRFSPLESEHAPHLYGYRYAHGKVTERWPTWEGRGVREMLDGWSAAFLVDLLDENDEIAFRIHFQDSAGPADRSLSRKWIEERPADLAVLCVPPYWHLEDYPEAILEAARVSYVLPVHYEDFLQPIDRPLRFVRSLTDARMDTFLARVEHATEGRPVRTPVAPTCGPAGERWTMPLPGEWIGFDVTEIAVVDSMSR